MQMQTFETGLQFGRALEQIKSHEDRLGKVETGHAELRAEVSTMRAVLIRGALLLALWAAGVGGHLSAEQVGETLAATIKSLRK